MALSGHHVTFADEISAALDSTALSEGYGRKLLRKLGPSFLEIARTDIFSKLAQGKLPIETIRASLTYIFPFIQTFPTYLQLTLAKVPSQPEKEARAARAWIAGNVALEKHHTSWFKDWATGFGVARGTLESDIQVPVEVAALDQYLHHISHGGSFVESIAAVNLAVEGATGLWARSALDGIRGYSDRTGVRLTKRSLRWLNAHASYDDRHAIEAIQIIESFARTRMDQERAEQAALQSLRHYLKAAESCMASAGNFGVAV